MQFIHRRLFLSARKWCVAPSLHFLALAISLTAACGESETESADPSTYALQAVPKPKASTAPTPTLLEIGVERGSQAVISSMRLSLTVSAQTRYELKTHAGMCRLVLGSRAAPNLAETVQTGWSKASTLELTRSEQATVIDVRTDPTVTCRAFHLSDPFRVLLDLDAPRPASMRPIVVLDPGHGGDDYGARAGDLHESDLVLDIARRVGGILERSQPELLVLQTRTDDRFIELERRVAFANAVGALAFVSIHLNSADEEVKRGGVSTFVLDTSGSAQARKLAAHENGTSLSGVSELQTLLATLHRDEQVRESRELATFVQQGVLVGTRQTLPNLHDRGVREALFAVLVGAHMPAVLVEGSFLTQPQEAAALAKGDYRQDIARGIASGIMRYLDAQPN